MHEVIIKELESHKQNKLSAGEKRFEHMIGDGLRMW